jgi:hypothetical protein
MKMIKSFIPAIIVYFFLFNSCAKDDDSCTPPAFNENIIATWNISYTILSSTQSGTGTFNSDGTFTTSPSNLIVGSDGDEKTYTISGDNIIFKSKSGGVTNSIDGTLKSNECNRIEIQPTSFSTTFYFTK